LQTDTRCFRGNALTRPYCSDLPPGAAGKRSVGRSRSDGSTVLNCPHGASSKLTPLVEEFIRDGVMFVGVVGKDCSLVEDLIDEIVVGNGTRDAFILTSSHPGETVSEVSQFALALTDEYAGEDIAVVELAPDLRR
jgi:hypothetical protein